MTKPLFLLPLLMLPLFACGEKDDTSSPEGDTDTDTDTDTDADTDLGPSYADEVEPILISLCGSCHGIQDTYGDLDVTSYDTLMASGTVVAGDSAHSTLVTQGSHHGSGWYAPEEEETVAGWIDAGALDD